jgi:hypothetical protein
MLTTEAKKQLTEDVLHECYHERTEEGLREWTVCTNKNCSSDHPQRTFTARDDLMDLYSALWMDGRWEAFQRKAYINCGNDLRAIDGTFDAWLTCLSGEGYEDRCEMVYNFVKGER